MTLGAAAPGCPGWGRGVFIQISKHPPQLEMRFAVRTVFSIVWVLCFNLNRGLDRSLLPSSEFHTCTLLFGLGFVMFSFSLFFNYKTFTLFLKAAAPILEICSCKTFALVCCIFFWVLLFF